MKKVLFFTAGPKATLAEESAFQALVTANETNLATMAHFELRNASVPAVPTVSREQADYVAGSPPAAYSNVPAWTGSGSSGGVKTMRQVTTRCAFNSNKLGAPQADGATVIRACTDISGLGVTIINAFGQTEEGPGAPATYKIVYEYNGQLATINWSSAGGSSTTGTTGTVANGAVMDSDYTEFGFTIPKGAYFKRRMYVTCSNGILCTRGTSVRRLLNGSVDRFNFSGSASPSIDSTGLSKADYDIQTTQQYSGGIDFVLKPQAEWAMSAVEAVALVGDSRTIGATYDIPEGPDWLNDHAERLIGGAYPFGNFGASSEKGFDWASGANGTLRKSVIKRFFQAEFFGYLTNDLGSATNAQYLPAIITAAKALPHRVGMKFYGATIPPRLGGNPTDYYTTYTGQGLATGDNWRKLVNVDILANANGWFDRVFDENKFVEDSATGKIKIYENARQVAGVSIDATGLITAPAGTFNVVDEGHNVFASGWAFTEGGTGTSYVPAGRVGILKYVSATQAYLVNIRGYIRKPTAAATDLTLLFGANDPSSDGIHFSERVLKPLDAIKALPL